MLRRRLLRFIALLAACAIALPAAASDARSRRAARDDDGPLLIFAASSLQGALDGVVAPWIRGTGRDTVVSYAASSTLARQIEQGAPADVFISADAEWMDWLAERDRIVGATRVDLLGNDLVLVAPAAADAQIATTADVSPATLLPRGLGERGRLAVADVYLVPAGRYAKEALVAIDRWDDVADRLAMADNVRTALMFVARGEAPLGIVYATDAHAERRVRVVSRFPADTHAPIVYPAAAIAGSDPDAAGFVAYLSRPSAAETFRTAGFRVLADDGRTQTPARDE